MGHLVMGVEMLAEKVERCAELTGEPFPPELLLRLKHMIVSHHGTYEFGSPKLPMTLEAMALHLPRQPRRQDPRLHAARSATTPAASRAGRRSSRAWAAGCSRGIAHGRLAGRQRRRAVSAGSRLVLDPTMWATAMPRFRISLASLLGIVAVIAMGLAGMVSASSLWTTAAATVTPRLLLSAVLAARLLTGIDRAFWAGFALFGWSYLLAGQLGLGRRPVRPRPDGRPERRRRVDLRRRAVPGAAALAGHRPPPRRRPAAPDSATPSTCELVARRQIQLGNFVQIGRMILSLIFGLLGGWIARVVRPHGGKSAAEAAGVRRHPAPIGPGAG